MAPGSNRLLALVAAAACLLVAACGSDPPPASVPTPGPATSATPGGAPAAAGSSVDIPLAGAPPVAGHPWFLAVGDSITSGFTIDSARAGTNSAWPLQLQSMLAASGRTWSLYDVACPGETTASYVTGCHDRRVVAQLGGRPQHDLALDAIRSHGADLKLIVVDLGSNDLLRVLRGGGDPATVAASLQTSLTAIVGELHRAAPAVPLLLTDFYNPLANLVPGTEAQLPPVNAGVLDLARTLGVTPVDFHAAINAAPPPDPALCQWIDCAHIDVHPTVAGHRRLAETALAALPPG